MEEVYLTAVIFYKKTFLENTNNPRFDHFL